jgi:predicted amidohydrolase YtcJ
MNYGTDELTALVAAFTAQGVPVACHVHGGVTFEAVLHAYEKAAADDARRLRAHRPRLELCGAVTAGQYRRAARLGATVILFMDHVRWWGDVLGDDLFGPDVAARWMAARSALDAGHRISLHNDGICSPTDPLSSVATAITRRCCPSGRVHGPGAPLAPDGLYAVMAWPGLRVRLRAVRRRLCSDRVRAPRVPAAAPRRTFPTPR